MRLRVAMAVLAIAVVASGCSVLGDGGSVGFNDWTLVGETPDGQHLRVTTSFGGVASGCSRWEGWEVDEAIDHVEIRALLWRKDRPFSCTDEGIIQTIEIELAQSLGDRNLVGCGVDDCRRAEFQPRVGSWNGSRNLDAVVTPSGVAVANAGTLWSFDADGEVRRDRAGAGLLRSSDNLVIGYLGRGTAGYEAQTGFRIWQTAGTLAAAYDGVVFVCRGDGADVVAAVDAATGAEQWSAAVPCEFVVSHYYDDPVVAGDRVVDGGNEWLLLDPSTGRVVLREALDDGVNDQVAGFGGDLVALGLDGQELLRRANGTGAPIGFVAGLVIVAARDRAAAVDPVTGDTIWSSQDHSYSSLTVSGDVLWSVEAAIGEVSRLDPRTGEPSWTATVGATSGFAVAANQTIAYVATSLAVIALNPTTGEVQWWQHLPYEQP